MPAASATSRLSCLARLRTLALNALWHNHLTNISEALFRLGTSQEVRRPAPSPKSQIVWSSTQADSPAAHLAGVSQKGGIASRFSYRPLDVASYPARDQICSQRIRVVSSSLRRSHTSRACSRPTPGCVPRSVRTHRSTPMTPQRNTVMRHRHPRLPA
jgi:hypothetical protein